MIIKKDFCKDCAWSRCGEKLEFCVDMQTSTLTYCSRHYMLDDENEELICAVCSKEKDPGKCWWCGN